MQKNDSGQIKIHNFKLGISKVFKNLEKQCSDPAEFVALLEIMCLMAFERKSEIETNLEADTRIVQ